MKKTTKKKLGKEIKAGVMSALHTAILKSFDIGPSQGDQVLGHFREELKKVRI